VDLRKIIEANKEDLKVLDYFMFKRDQAYAKLIGSLLIEQAHSSRTMDGENLRQRFYCPGMVIQVRRFVRDCKVCAETKPTNKDHEPVLGKKRLCTTRSNFRF